MTPLPTTNTEVAKVLKQTDMKLDVLDEPWNQYDLDDDIKIFLKAVATSISSTSIYDAQGEPAYFVSHQVLTKKYPLI